MFSRVRGASRIHVTYYEVLVVEVPVVRSSAVLVVLAQQKEVYYEHITNAEMACSCESKLQAPGTRVYTSNNIMISR